MRIEAKQIPFTLGAVIAAGAELFDPSVAAGDSPQPEPTVIERVEGDCKVDNGYLICKEQEQWDDYLGWAAIIGVASAGFIGYRLVEGRIQNEANRSEIAGKSARRGIPPQD